MAKPLTQKQFYTEWSRRIPRSTFSPERMDEIYQALVDTVYHEVGANGQITLPAICTIRKRFVDGGNAWNPYLQCHTFVEGHFSPSIRFVRQFKEFVRSEKTYRQHKVRKNAKSKKIKTEKLETKQYALEAVLQTKRETGAKVKDIIAKKEQIGRIEEDGDRETD